MRQRLWADLVETPQDLDYVERFQRLAALNLEMRKDGPTVPILLRKSILETGVGNHAAALQAALDAVALDGGDAEAHHQVGRASLMLALVRAGVVPQTGDGGGQGTATGLLGQAAGEFRAAAGLVPGDDESLEDAAFLESMLEANDTEAALVEAIRASWPSA